METTGMVESKGLKITSWVLQIVAAAILLQTLFFKFAGAPEPVAIFSALGAEPYGRLGTATLELVAGLSLLVPRTAVWGALLAAGLMGGAVFSHLTVLGITLDRIGVNDGGALFSMALVVLLSSLAVLFLRRREILDLLARFRS